MGKTSNFIRFIRAGASKHGSQILLGLGIAGSIGTVVMAVKATPKALTIMDEKIACTEADDGTLGMLVPIEEVPRHLTAKEKVQLTWKLYLPAAISGTLSIACLICSHKIDTRKNMALATAYALTESALKEYQDKVVEVVGEKQERSIRDAIAKDHVDQNPVVSREVIITKSGDTLCFDSISGRYFKSDIEKIRKSVNDLNSRLNHEMYISLNELYEELGLKSVAIGYELGWNVAAGLIDLYFSSTLAEDGTPCLVLDFTNNPPKYNFNRFG